MPRLADHAGVVPATGEDEGQLRITEQVHLVDGWPRGDVIAHRADDEHRRFDVGDRHRPSADLVAPLGQIVVQIQAPQVLAVHAIWHARHVGVPGHQVIELLAFAQQVLAHAAGPDQVARVEHLERCGHLLAVEIAFVPHPGF